MNTEIKQKIANFIRKPHFPSFLINKIRKLSPPLARFLRYGRYNINTEGYWNKVYQSGIYQNVQDERYGFLYQKIIDLIPVGSKVLDAGCGTGKFMEMLRNNKLCNCVGIDISEIAIKMVKNKGFQGFKCKLPNLPPDLRDDSFDVCTLTETLEHISNPFKTIKNLSMIIKKGGYIIISVPDNCMKPEDLDEHVNSFNIQGLQALLKSYFKIETTLSIEKEKHKYLIVRAKKIAVP